KKSNKQDTAHALNLKQHHHKESYTTIHHTTFNITYKIVRTTENALNAILTQTPQKEMFYPGKTGRMRQDRFQLTA
ncbi:hypothetical protein LVK58_28315, partial [Escherichia coli]|uniref:hypothetical protein n=1 Tax=Escherichia coli TaxID=562 RepID=UPI00263BF137